MVLQSPILVKVWYKAGCGKPHQHVQLVPRDFTSHRHEHMQTTRRISYTHTQTHAHLHYYTHTADIHTCAHPHTLIDPHTPRDKTCPCNAKSSVETRPGTGLALRRRNATLPQPMSRRNDNTQLPSVVLGKKTHKARNTRPPSPSFRYLLKQV